MTPEGREAARRLVWTIKREGFSQLRKTNDGYLYGSGTHRFLLPYAVVRGAATASMMEELAARFAQVVAARNATEGRPRMASVTNMEPVEDPEDLLRDEGGPPVADTGVVSPAGAGSTPVPLATETERPGPAVLSGAPEGSTPSGLPTLHPTPPPNAEETPMAKRRPRTAQACSKCGKTFDWPAARGRHEQHCTGKPKPVKEAKAPRTPRQPRTITATVPASTNGFTAALAERLTAFETAAKDIVLLVKDLGHERDHYKREYDQLATWKQQLSTIFERPAVPR